MSDPTRMVYFEICLAAVDFLGSQPEALSKLLAGLLVRSGNVTSLCVQLS